MSQGDERLRALFRDASAEAPGGPVDAELVWRAVRGELPQDELEALIDRCATDPDAALAWRLALELVEDRAQPEFTAPPPANDPHFRRRWWVPMALAAAVLLAVVAPRLLPLDPDPIVSPTLRSGDVGLELVEVDSAVRGADLVLTWSAAPAGTEYTLIVTDPAARTLYRVEALPEAHATIPGDVTARWSVDRVLWRVVGVTRDGRPLRSPVASIDLR